jgi:hypothetical protein
LPLGVGVRVGVTVAAAVLVAVAVGARVDVLVGVAVAAGVLVAVALTTGVRVVAVDITAPRLAIRGRREALALVQTTEPSWVGSPLSYVPPGA